VASASRYVDTASDGVASYVTEHVGQHAVQRVASAQPLGGSLVDTESRVSVNWFVVCSKGFGSGSKSGSFKARTTARAQATHARTQPG
jgi:hypothetical protein